MTIVILVASKIIPSINKLGGALTTISNVGLWISTSLNDIFKSSEELQELQIFEKRKIIKWSELKFENVNFKYSNNSLNSISDLNIKIVGKYYGFVGKSGAGKSTIIDLFIGLLILTKGQIKVNDIPLEEIGINNWQSNIGYVPQKPPS